MTPLERGPDARPGTCRMSLVNRSLRSAFKRIRLWWNAGSGAAKVAAARSCGLSPGRGYAKAPRAFADPLAFLLQCAISTLHQRGPSGVFMGRAVNGRRAGRSHLWSGRGLWSGSHQAFERPRANQSGTVWMRPGYPALALGAS